MQNIDLILKNHIDDSEIQTYFYIDRALLPVWDAVVMIGFL